MYQHGKGIPQDDKTAMKWFRLAAEQGLADAQFNLGVMYRNGLGVPQNYKTAVKWYRLAAEQGLGNAQNNMGVMYRNGLGVIQNSKTGEKWFRLAAEQGNASAKINVEEIEREKREKAERIAREKQIASNPGFRDLKPGLQNSEIRKFCPDLFGSSNKHEVICYGLQNLKFNGKFDYQNYLTLLTVNLGPIVGSGGFLNELATYMQKGETNIYLKMRNALGEKYKLDFEYSERDRQLFNKDEKKKLYTVYEKGQVALLITRKKKNYSRELWLYIEYRDVKPAQAFFKSAKPKRAKKSDF